MNLLRPRDAGKSHSARSRGRQAAHQWYALLAVAACTAAQSLPRDVAASPSIWERTQAPEQGDADELLALAERSRTPTEEFLDGLPPLEGGEGADELRRKLNARAVTLIRIADGATLGDVRLLFLLGDALVKAGPPFLEAGVRQLRRALERAPESPLAGEAWFRLAIAEGKLGHHGQERDAYSQALRFEWHPEVRSTLTMNRAEAAMSDRDLGAATVDYGVAMQLSRSMVTRSLAMWGLAVALERDGDLPAALSFAEQASSQHFGDGRLALDLPDVYFNPAYEKHYYRALGLMASAASASDAELMRQQLQAAELLWSMYLKEAEGDPDAWTSNAQRHLAWCRYKLKSTRARD